MGTKTAKSTLPASVKTPEGNYQVGQLFLNESQYLVYQQMTPALQVKSQLIQGMLNESSGHRIMEYWKLGKEIKEIHQPPSNGADFGAAPDRQLAQVLTLGGKFQSRKSDAARRVTTLNNARRIAERYETEDDIKAILEMCNPETGQRVDVSHLILLLNERDKSKAQHLLEYAISSSFGPSALEAHLSRIRGRPGRNAGQRAGGRPKPKNFAGVLEQMSSICSEYDQLTDVWSEVLGDGFEKLPEETRASSETIERLGKTQEIVATTSAHLTVLESELGRLLRRASHPVDNLRDVADSEFDDDDGSDRPKPKNFAGALEQMSSICFECGQLTDAWSEVLVGGFEKLPEETRASSGTIERLEKAQEIVATTSAHLTVLESELGRLLRRASHPVDKLPPASGQPRLRDVADSEFDDDDDDDSDD